MPENKRFVYEFGKFLLDPDQRTLFFDGQPLRLQAKEFETLLVLVEHNGKAVSKEEIMTAVWQDAFVEEGNLAKQISRLRKILNTSGNEFIETIPKHGYRFSADVQPMATIAEDGLILEKRTVKRVTVAIEDETEPLALPAPVSSRSIWPRAVIVLLSGAIVIGAVVIWDLQSGKTSGINSMAVLPLRSLNDDQDARVLGLGLTDALITKLGSLRKVIVRPTNAVAPLSDQADPLDTGRRLGVDAVLEGTIQQADGRLRVNARLLKTTTGEQIWADKFDEPLAGLFALQDALSSNIAKALAFELTKSDFEQLQRRGTENAEAYEKYLRGRFYLSQGTAEGFNKSIELFEQAIALDPNFAEAYAGIADANVILFNFGISTAEETVPNARHAIARAMQLNPELSNVHTSLALIQFLTDKNWPEAEKSLQRAIELNGNNADAFLRYGYFLINVGKFDDALEKLSKARELNPLSPIIQTDIGLAYLFAHRYPEAIEQLRKTAADNPKFSLPLWLLGTAFEESGDGEQSFIENLKALEIEGGGAFAAELKRIKDEQGLSAANRFWFNESVQAKTARGSSVKEQLYIPAMTIALRAATVKDGEQTLFWLEKAVEEKDPTLVQIKYFSKFDFVRGDPRFQAISEKLIY